MYQHASSVGWRGGGTPGKSNTPFSTVNPPPPQQQLSALQPHRSNPNFGRNGFAPAASCPPNRFPKRGRAGVCRTPRWPPCPSSAGLSSGREFGRPQPPLPALYGRPTVSERCPQPLLQPPATAVAATFVKTSLQPRPTNASARQIKCGDAGGQLAIRPHKPLMRRCRRAIGNQTPQATDAAMQEGNWQSDPTSH